jgi:hypothetical protein
MQCKSFHKLQVWCLTNSVTATKGQVGDRSHGSCALGSLDSTHVMYSSHRVLAMLRFSITAISWHLRNIILLPGPSSLGADQHVTVGNLV